MQPETPGTLALYKFIQENNLIDNKMVLTYIYFVGHIVRIYIGVTSELVQ